MTDSQKKSTTVLKSMLLIAGMHRSGTSALTRVLSLSGATLPKSLLAPVKEENEKGFWESQKIMEFHDKALEASGTDWNSLHSVPIQWFSSDEALSYKVQLIRLIESEFGCFEIGVIKDPRICKLAPLWQAALTDMGIATHVIIPIRNPIEVARSLEARNGYSLNYSLSLWFNYLILIEQNTRNTNRTIVNYDSLLTAPLDVISHINNHLNLTLDFKSDYFKEEVSNFLSKSLRHHHASMDDLQSSTNIPEVVKHLYSWLNERSILNLANADSRIELNIDELLEQHANSDFTLWQKNLRQTERQLNDVYSSIKELSKQKALYLEREVKRNQSIESLQAKCQEQSIKSETLDKQCQKLVSQHLKLENQHLELEKAHLTLNNHHRSITQTHESERKQHNALEKKFIKQKEELSSLSKEFIANKNDVNLLRKEHDIILQAHKNNALELKEKRELNNELIALNAQISEKLRNTEKNNSDQRQITAWKLGTSLTKLVRHFRSSLIGRALLVFKAFLSLNISQYLSFQKRLRIIRHSGLFDEAFYLETYPLIQYSTKSPIEHYAGNGEREGRQPNSVFLPYFYSQSLSNGVAKWGSPLVHYIKEGANTGIDPSPIFSTKFYAQAHGIKPSESLRHYLKNNKNSVISNIEKEQAHSPVSIDENELVASNVITPPPTGPIETEISAIMSELEHLSLDEKLANISFNAVTGPLVSIIIPFFNKVEYTIDCLFSLSKQTFQNFEVILIDDASSDENCSLLSSIEGITIIKNDTNLGYLLSCNLAAKSSTAEYIVQLNNDTIVLEEWLSSLITTYDKIPGAGLVGSLLLSRSGTISEAGGIIFNDASGYNFGRGRSPYDKRFNYIRETDYCSGASIIIKRHIWELLEGYDTLYAPAYYEDTDLAMKVRELGYKVIYNPFSKAVHHEGISSGTDLSSGIKKYQEINKAKFYKKWRNKLDIKPPIPNGDLINNYVRRQRKSGWILWIDSVTPTPDKDSGSIDTVNFFEQALNDDWGVTFMPWDGLRHEGPYTTDLLSMGVECIFDPSYSAEQHLHNIDDSYDVVVLSRVTVAKYAYPIIKKRYPNAKIVFNTVDLHFLRYERESDLFAKSTQHQLSIRSQKVEREEELELVRNCDVTVVVSQSEKEILQEYVKSANIRVIPLFRDVVGCNNAYEDRFNIGFIGGYQHPPNIDAVKYFVSEVWPLVSKKIKNCNFIITGSNVPEEIQQLAGSRIEVRGFIPTVEELFEEVKIMVAPLRYGAGIKGKVVSGLCHGVPQVVSSEAAEGMGLENTGAASITSNPQEFANAIIDLYSNKEKWQDMSGRALDVAHKNYSKDAISNKITRLLHEL